jgi:ABC-type transport system involved in cytochrome c biogenesis permease component
MDLANWACIFIVIYFIPAYVAFRRWHRSDLAIFVLNLFLGWTALGWILALVWACTGDVHRKEFPGIR